VASVFDVARHILEKTGPLSTMKLQKLVYYAQAWSLVWDDPPDAPIFGETIQAWLMGPVVPVLFEAHRGLFSISAAQLPCGSSTNLTANQKDTIDRVVDFYGKRSAQWLSDLAHSEEPWILARRGIPEGQRGNAEISLDSMRNYYESL